MFLGNALQQRSCISCRAKATRSELLRFVCAPAGCVRLDLQQRLPGRGAYTCPSAKCVQVAAERGRFPRSFRCTVSVPPWRKLWAEVEGQTQKRANRPVSALGQACQEAEPRLESAPLNVGPLEGSKHDED